MRHLILAALACAAAASYASPAHACQPRYLVPEARLHPSSEAAQSVRLHVESKAQRGFIRYTLHDADGGEVEVATPEVIAINDASFEGGYITIYEPASPLEPGTYTYRLADSEREYLDQVDDPGADVPLEHTFTITGELPPEGDVPSPELTWRVISYAGEEDPDLGDQANFPCSVDPGTHLMTLEFEAVVPDATTPGFITVSFDGDAASAYTNSASTIASSPRLASRISDTNLDFVQCVTATFTDVYGRSSQPTRSCLPDQCVAKHRNDRDPVDWDDVPGCEDWSPGFAERNAPACACAQVPSSPSGSPALLGLGLLGLLGLRRRR